MAARRSAQAVQPTIPQTRDSAQTPCPMNPYCAAEFASIATNYQNLTERMDRLETKFDAGMESLRSYLKEEYAQSIDFRISALTARIEVTEKQIAGMQKTLNEVSKKIVYASGGIAVLSFLIGVAVSLLPRLLGGK